MEKIGLLAAIPFISICTLFGVYFVRKRTHNKPTCRYCETENGNIAGGEPLIQSNCDTIKEFIEHTTSGSGSGMLLSSLFLFPHSLRFNLFKKFDQLR